MEMVILTAMGILAVRWAMKGAYDLGHDDFAHDLTDIFTFFNLSVYEAMASTGIFCGIFFANSLLDKLTGTPIILTMANKHIISDVIAATLVTQILLWAMIIEGIRIRRHYYEFVAPLRKLYLSFPKRRLVRPSFFELYRLW
jgi:hypothetical protein